MTEIFVLFGSALWLGILTSISPCPLAANIAAVSFLSKKVTHPAMVFLSGLAYTLGRMVAYAALGWVLISSLLSVHELAQFVQNAMSKALGPLLMVTGLLLLEIITLKLPSFTLSPKYSNRLGESGAPGAFLLGFVLALAFCPISAALFFGSLISLALNSKIGIALPFVYGIGTGVPVLIFAMAIALGVTSMSHWFQRITRLEYYSRRITGVIFILVGLYYVGIYNLKLAW